MHLRRYVRMYVYLGFWRGRASGRDVIIRKAGI